MTSNANKDRPILIRILKTLRKNGPVSTIWRVCKMAQKRCSHIPVLRNIFCFIDRMFVHIFLFLDRPFDRKCGTETTGYIAHEDLKAKSESVKKATWYMPISAKVFAEILDHLTIEYSKFDFLDMGSGKGRALLIASDYGFKRVIGVEFDESLHRTALRNMAVYNRHKNKTVDAECLCLDATQYSVPKGPLVIFFCSPFTGEVMKKVLDNIMASYRESPRKILLIFYGWNPESIALFKATGFSWEESSLKPDWSIPTQFKGFIFKSPECG